jgi:hypothetical protein
VVCQWLSRTNLHTIPPWARRAVRRKRWGGRSGRRRLDAANAERAAILADLADAPPPPGPVAFREAAAAAKDLAAALAGGSPAARRRALAALGATVTIGADGLAISYGGVFARLLGGGSGDDGGE